jgi:hypothetical protein
MRSRELMNRVAFPGLKVETWGNRNQEVPR